MRIRIKHRPTTTSVDGLELDRFEVGQLYEVGTTLGILMLAEGWAEPATSEQPILPMPISDTSPPTALAESAIQPPSNLIREIAPPSVSRLDLAADFERRKRRR
jgi:hypothetical protein